MKTGVSTSPCAVTSRPRRAVAPQHLKPEAHRSSRVQPRDLYSLLIPERSNASRNLTREHAFDPPTNPDYSALELDVFMPGMSASVADGSSHGVVSFRDC